MKKKNWKMGWALMLALCLSLGFALAGCGEEDNNSNSNNNNAGIYKIEMSGGQGIEGDGGDGGDLDMATYGTYGINILQAKKDVNTAFNLPPEAKLDLGDDPAIIDANTTIDVYVDQATAQAATADGDYYLYLGNSNLYIRDSVGGDYTATGLDVRQGRTLTLGLNYTFGGQTGQDTAYIYFGYDVIIAGQVKTKDLTTGNVGGLVVELPHGAATVRDKGALYIYANTISVKGSGLLNTSGDDADVTDDRGGDGGGVYLYGDNVTYMHGKIDATGGRGDGLGIGGDGAVGMGPMNQVYVESDDGVLVVTGLVDASGGDGASGGTGGYIDLEGYTFTFITGKLVSNGGDARGGLGGDGGGTDGIYILSYYSGVLSRGDIISNGGNAELGDAGDSGGIDIDAADEDDYMGQLVLAGTVQADGGNSKLGDGGDGGDLDWYVYGSGDCRVTAKVSAQGGNGKGAGSWGGDAGDLDLTLYAYEDYGDDEEAKNGDIVFAAPLNFSGGNGDNGGSGGDIDLDNDDGGSYYNDEVAPTYGIFLYGYSAIRSAGGDGAGGGDGGDLDFETEDPQVFSSYNFTVGSIIDETDYIAPGGRGTDGWGGDGGDFDEESEGEAYSDNSVCIHSGNVRIGGGNGTDGGGDSGDLYFYGHELAKFIGDIDASGGNGTGIDADGGDAYEVMINSTYDVIILGNINASGGNATGTGSGGDGAYYDGSSYYGVSIYAGAQAKVHGNIDASGGNGDKIDGYGGDGGYIDVFSEWLPSVVKGWNVKGGAADDPGDLGEMKLDWTVMTP